MKQLLFAVLLLSWAHPSWAQDQGQQCIDDDQQGQGQQPQGQGQPGQGQDGPCSQKPALLDQLQCLQKKTEGVIKHLKKNMKTLEDGSRAVVEKGAPAILPGSQALADGSPETVTAEQRLQYKQNYAGIPDKVKSGCSAGQENLDKGHQKFACVDSVISALSNELEQVKQNIQQNLADGAKGNDDVTSGNAALAEASAVATPAQIASARQALATVGKRVATAQKTDQELQQKLASQIDKTLQQLKTLIGQGGSYHKFESQAQAVLKKGDGSGEGNDIYSCLGDQGTLQGDLGALGNSLDAQQGTTFSGAEPRVSEAQTRFQRDLSTVEGSEGKTSSDLESLGQLLQGVGTGIEQERQPDADSSALTSAMGDSIKGALSPQ